uniref:Ribosomal protein L27 n=2 Tax=Timema TaxID=61471 RepID=A0A7R9E5B7_9NEOP|nr:unnamed protein product [Timema cristinae]CAD7427704.1 unnamed protein product [Timema monikensis]
MVVVKPRVFSWSGVMTKNLLSGVDGSPRTGAPEPWSFDRYMSGTFTGLATHLSPDMTGWMFWPGISEVSLLSISGLFPEDDEDIFVKAGSVRWASKKTSGSTRNQKGHARPKHRGVRVQDGHYVQQGTLLAVGLGGNGMLYAKEAGRVMVTCEKIDPNWNHNWVQKVYGERSGQTIFKKFFNVIAEPQVGRFKLIDTI